MLSMKINHVVDKRMNEWMFNRSVKHSGVVTFTFGIMLSLFTSCYTNSIYFDMESQSVIRCNGTIRNILKSKSIQE